VLKLVTTFGGGMIATNDNPLWRQGFALASRNSLGSSLGRQAAKGLHRSVMDIGTRKLVFSLGPGRPADAARHPPDIQQRMMTETRTGPLFRSPQVPPMHLFQAGVGAANGPGGAVHRAAARRRAVAR